MKNMVVDGPAGLACKVPVGGVRGVAGGGCVSRRLERERQPVVVVQGVGRNCAQRPREPHLAGWAHVLQGEPDSAFTSDDGGVPDLLVETALPAVKSVRTFVDRDAVLGPVD